MSQLPGPSRPPSSSEPSTHEAKNSPQVHYRVQPFIRIIQPPNGRHSPRPDERCLTYCSQSVAGRLSNGEPWCRSICIRKVFSHEVRNILGFARHRRVGPDGQAKYPLPDEAQRQSGAFGEKELHPNRIKHWEEGWYLWFSKSRWAAVERMDLMSWSLERQAVWIKAKEERKARWEEWENRPRGRTRDNSLDPSHEHHTCDHRPAGPFPDLTGLSLLIHLPPPLPPIYDQIQTLLQPTYKVLGIFHQSFESGAQIELAGRLWEKAWTAEPFRLVTVVCSKMWEKWKEGPPGGKKGI